MQDKSLVWCDYSPNLTALAGMKFWYGVKNQRHGVGDFIEDF